MQANVHQNEGAMSIIQSVTKQLAQAKDQLGELQSSGAGSANVERETVRVFKLEMTLETLQAELVDNDCSSEVLEINREIAMMDEIIPILNARVDFVNMKRRKSPVHLQVLAPKVPPPNAEILQVPDSCSACGLLMYDEEALRIFILPCKHAYHIYCFANLAGREGKCLAASCGHVIYDNIKELMFIDSEGDTSTGCLKFESSSKKKKEPQILSTKSNDNFDAVKGDLNTEVISKEFEGGATISACFDKEETNCNLEGEARGDHNERLDAAHASKSAKEKDFVVVAGDTSA
ncbi:hypothetical protein L7F22_044838 [Adiantum nelumboides]|nr:hypothetical protein [Adiantum nelumboides]